MSGCTGYRAAGSWFISAPTPFPSWLLEALSLLHVLPILLDTYGLQAERPSPNRRTRKACVEPWVLGATHTMGSKCCDASGGLERPKSQQRRENGKKETINFFKYDFFTRAPRKDDVGLALPFLCDVYLVLDLFLMGLMIHVTDQASLSSHLL